ncbi:MAG: hypothetical protein PHD43_03230 [Methylococcales bacterium]|nr:hypothetical protein [Methylococcales bacterium]
MNAKIVITALLVTLAIVFLFLFRNQVGIDFSAPFGAHLKMSGSNENASPAGVSGKDLKAGDDINAVDKGGQRVEVEKAEAKGSITLTNEAPLGGTSSPKQ